MESISRGDWSRASGELCKAAAAAAQKHYHDHDGLEKNSHDHDPHNHVTSGKDDATTSITPLLLSTDSNYGTDNDDAVDYEHDEEDSCSNDKKSHKNGEHRRRSSSIQQGWDEAYAMINLAIPVIVTYLFEMLPGIVSIVLVGHVDSPASKEYLDAAALAVMFTNLTALSIGIGLVTAMDTLCSQAFGAGELQNKALVYMTTGALVCGMAFAIIFVVNYYASAILIALGQPTEIAQLAGIFVQYIIPGVPFIYAYEILRKVLQAQNIALPMLYVAILSNVLNCALGYYLVFGMDHTTAQDKSWLGPDGWLGAAVARTIGNITLPVFLIIYLYFSGHYKTFIAEDKAKKHMDEGANQSIDDNNHAACGTTGDSYCCQLLKEAWKGIPQFIELGVPGALQMCFEWWAFECLALISGLLPDAVVAIGSNAILLNIASMVYMFYLGVSIATNVRIGNALGANLPKRAALAATLGLGLAVTLSAFCASILLIFKDVLPELFTNDDEISEYTSSLLVIAAAFQLPDAINGTVQGIFRGSGRQTLGAWLNFVAYYGVGIPIGVFLAFTLGQSLWGLWVGMTMGLLVIGVVGLYLVFTSNWKSLADDANKRLS